MSSKRERPPLAPKNISSSNRETRKTLVASKPSQRSKSSASVENKTDSQNLSILQQKSTNNDYVIKIY